MRLRKWLVPALVVAATAVAGGWLFSRGARVQEVEPMESELAATPAQTTLPAETPMPIQDQEQGLLLKAQGTWQDPPLPAEVPPADTPMPPWYPPYDARVDWSREPWSSYSRQRDLDRRRGTSWIESFCPFPKSRHALPGDRNDSWQTEPQFRQGFWDPFVSQPPEKYGEPWGR
jgi:hypothetical protein